MPRLIALFQSQFQVDRFVTDLERHGFQPGEVTIVLFAPHRSVVRPKGFLDWISRGGVFGDTMDQSDGVSTMDSMTVTASLGALWGLVWGFRLRLGPVAWAHIGLLFGGVVGLIIDRIIPERRRAKYATRRQKGLIQVDVDVPDQERYDRAREILMDSEPDQFAEIKG